LPEDLPAMPLSFAKRVCIPELMDDPNLDPIAHQAALRGLARLNRLSDASGVLWPVIREHWKRINKPSLRLLDIATGAGDLPIQLAKRAQKEQITLQIEACDISDTALAHAAEQARSAGVSVRFFQQDVLNRPLPAGYDIVTSSLFLHHLAESDVVRVLQRMRDASTGLILVNDLLRNALNYVLVWLGTRLVTRSPVVHFDGPVSVRAAFTISELRELAQKADLTSVRVEARHPCRLLLLWSHV
jgi:2-polyprenyl-3-methyl-5-hydroxy-6-metoxy-1,4-benzoquinol methylase